MAHCGKHMETFPIRSIPITGVFVSLPRNPQSSELSKWTKNWVHLFQTKSIETLHPHSLHPFASPHAHPLDDHMSTSHHIPLLFCNLNCFTLWMGCIHNHVLVSDNMVCPSSSKISITLTWSFVCSHHYILNEFIHASTHSIIHVQAFGACFLLEIAMEWGGEGLWKFHSRCMYYGLLLSSKW
jgi:hypothetical protein